MKSIRENYQHTIYASYIGYITQAIVNNFAPLLFLTFHNSYRIPLSQIGLLTTINFGTQLLIDLLSAKFTDRIGCRTCVVLAHVFAAAGLIALGVLPCILPYTFAALCIAVILCAIGGGLTEVLISPIVEACPTEGKAAAMSLLHSFYCWGSVLVVVLSTILFRIFGMDAWILISCLWAIVPICNSLYFSRVPIPTLVAEGEGMSVKEILRARLFWSFALMMICAGASELAMSQWASAFAESGLQVSKTVGDLAGPCFFALLMGAARLIHSKCADRVDLYGYLSACSILCIFSYLLAALSPLPVLSLLGCGVCGISVGAMWPGTYSLASRECPKGGTALFALLALTGDFGCSLGPTMVGFISSAAGDNLKKGLLFAAVFPALMILGLIRCRRLLSK